MRQLLDQTSGLADREVHELGRPQPSSLAEATASLSPARLVAAPDTQFNYRNPNYQVAARLVEVLSGQTFDPYLREHVVLPAGMSASLTTYTDDEPVAGLADGHVIAYGHPVPVPAPATFDAGAGGVISTVADMRPDMRGLACTSCWGYFRRLRSSPSSEFPDIAALLMGGRDVNWVAAAYGWPALVVLVVAGLAATTATLIFRSWQLGRHFQNLANVPARPGQAAPRLTVLRKHEESP